MQIRPPRLEDGARIGVVSPSYWIDPARLERAVSVFEEQGYELVLGRSTGLKQDKFAGTPEERAADIMAMFTDDSIDAIVCARGGFGCLRILPLVDFDIIRTNPKIFVGYSDVTALLAAITRRSGLVTFHGPMVTPLAKAPAMTRRSLSAAITSDTPLKIAPAAGVALQDGRATGPVIGGNLATLCHLLGTPFEAKFENQILLLEDCGEAPYRIDRMLSQMKLAGSFKGIAGLILGSFKDCGNLDEIYRIFQDHFQDTNIPILAGFEVGHGRQNMTIPVGMAATLDTDQQLLSFAQSATIG